MYISSTQLNIIGTLCLFVGGIISAKPALMDIFLSLYCKASRNNQELSRIYKSVGYLLCGIGTRQWNELYKIHQIGIGNEKLIDEKAPLRGVVWLIIGTIILIVS